MASWIKLFLLIAPVFYFFDRLILKAFGFHLYSALGYHAKTFFQSQDKMLIFIFSFFFTMMVLLFVAILNVFYMKFVATSQGAIFLGSPDAYEMSVYREHDPLRKPKTYFGVPPFSGYSFAQTYKPFTLKVDPLTSEVMSKGVTSWGSLVKYFFIIVICTFFAIPCMVGLAEFYAKAHIDMFPHLKMLSSHEDYLFFFFKQIGIQKQLIIYYVAGLFGFIGLLFATIVGVALFGSKVLMKADPNQPPVPPDISRQVAELVQPGQIVTGRIVNWTRDKRFTDEENMHRDQWDNIYFVKFTNPFDPPVYVKYLIDEDAPPVEHLDRHYKNKTDAQFKLKQDLTLHFVQ